MKRIILFILFIQGSLLSAQHIRFGVKGGGDLSFFSASAPKGITIKPSPGGYIGAIIEVGKFDGSKQKFQVELVGTERYLKNNFKSNEVLMSRRSVRLTQISVPVMYRYFTRPSFSINVGGSMNYNVVGNSKSTNEQTKRTVEVDLIKQEQLEPLQLGLLAGINYYYRKGFFLDVRYNLMVTNTMKEIVKTSYNDYLHSIQVGVGYKFKHHSKW